MSEPVVDRITARLAAHGIDFEVLRHEPVFTSAQAARVRGTPLASGAKALLCKGKRGFFLFVMPADRQLDSRSVRRSLGWRQMRFATEQELLELTGLRPGSVPPFGSLFGVQTYCDALLTRQEQINFNAGDHAVSIRMLSADYLAVEAPELGSFSRESRG